MDLDSRGRSPRIGGAAAAGHARAGAVGVAAGTVGIPGRTPGAGVVTAHLGVCDVFGARTWGAARFCARPQFGAGGNLLARNCFGPDGLAAGRGGPGLAGHVRTAQAFVALPFLVISLEGALRSTSGKYAAIAATLGAGPTRVLARVTLPLAVPALVSGTALAFARALGEFGATLTFAGSLPGTTRTMPLLIYLAREQDQDLALALALVLVVVAVVIVILSARFQQIGR